MFSIEENLVLRNTHVCYSKPGRSRFKHDFFIDLIFFQNIILIFSNTTWPHNYILTFLVVTSSSVYCLVYIIVYWNWVLNSCFLNWLYICEYSQEFTTSVIITCIFTTSHQFPTKLSAKFYLRLPSVKSPSLPLYHLHEKIVSCFSFVIVGIMLFPYVSSKENITSLLQWLSLPKFIVYCNIQMSYMLRELPLFPVTQLAPVVLLLYCFPTPQLHG